MSNHRVVLKIVALTFGFLVLSLVAARWGSNPSKQQIQKRAHSPAPVLLQQAFEKANEVHDLGLLEMVAIAQAQSGDVFSALRTIQSVRSVEWRTRRCADLSNALSARGDIVGAIRVASTIDATSWARKEALSNIAQAQANAGEISSALKTAGELPGYLRADILQAVALRQVQDGQVEGAFKTLASIDLPREMVRRSRILTAIAVRQAGTNHIAAALKTVALLDGKWKATALGDVAQSLAGQEKLVIAAKIANSIEGDSYTKAMSFNGIAQTSQKSGDKLGAAKIRFHSVQIASAIHEGEYRNLALRAIAESAAEAHDWAAASKVTAQINDISHRILALTSIAVAQRASGLNDASSLTLASANEVLRSANDSISAENASYWIVVMYVRVGDFPAAVAAASRLADAKDINQCLAFSELALGQGTAGDAIGAARSLASIHVESPGGLVSCTKEGSRSAAVARAVRAGHLDAAMYIAKMGPEQCDMDRSIASGWVRLGDLYGSARWAYTRGSKVLEGCALVGMAEESAKH